MKQSGFRLSLPHRLWRTLPAGMRRRILASTATVFAPRIARSPVQPAGGLAVAGELTRASGLGEGARLMLHALDRLGVAHWPIDVSGLLPAHSADLPPYAEQYPPAAAPLVVHVNPPLLPLVLARLPRALVRSRRVIGFWYWELPVAPRDWRIGTRYVHEVWVQSHFTAAAIDPLLPGRVHVVPHPVALIPPAPSRLDRAAFGLPHDAVVVLVSFNLASSYQRKNPLAALAAFRMAFGDRPDRLLLMKVGNVGHFPADFDRIRAAAAGLPNVRLETRVFATADLHALTAACDIVLSLHRSEGFGLVLAEGMLLGKPVIATGWSGNLEFMDQDCAALVGYRLVDSVDSRAVYSGGTWAEPDVADAAAHLRRLADDAAARTALGEKGRQVALSRLSGRGLEAALQRLGLLPDAGPGGRL